MKDVAFCAPPVSRHKALDLLDRTQAGRLLAGYRRGPPRDREAVVTALIGLGRLAIDLGDVIESVDINPFVAVPEGGAALDGLIVLQRR
jgi:hypothetical protein